MEEKGTGESIRNWFHLLTLENQYNFSKLFKMYPRILKVKIFIYFKAYIIPCQVSKKQSKETCNMARLLEMEILSIQRSHQPNARGVY